MDSQDVVDWIPLHEIASVNIQEYQADPEAGTSAYTQLHAHEEEEEEEEEDEEEEEEKNC